MILYNFSKTDGDVYGVYTQLLGAGSFWFTSILILVTMFLTDYTYFNFKGLFLKKRIRTPSQMEMAEITHL